MPIKKCNFDIRITEGYMPNKRSRQHAIAHALFLATQL